METATLSVESGCRAVCESGDMRRAGGGHGTARPAFVQPCSLGPAGRAAPTVNIFSRALLCDHMFVDIGGACVSALQPLN